jgi:hypothetical protein
MLKIRYYKLRLPNDSGISTLASAAYRSGASGGISVLEDTSNVLFLKYTITRQIETIQIMSDGAEVRTSVPTMERHSIRLFQVAGGLVLSLLDPARGSRVTTEVLSKLVGSEDYFIEPLEISTKMIRVHVSEFDSARLVSAKVRDFRVYDGAIGRLEVSSKEGLTEEIAPFLAGKYHKIDSLTYEVTHQFKRGLICYSNSGTVKVSSPLVEVVFPTFERLL